MSLHEPYCDEQHTARQHCNDARKLTDHEAGRTSVAEVPRAAHGKWCDERHPSFEECNTRAIDGGTAADIALRLSCDGELPSATAIAEAIRSEARDASLPKLSEPGANTLHVAPRFLDTPDLAGACRGLVWFLIVLLYPVSVFLVHFPLLLTDVFEERPPTAFDEARPLRWVGSMNPIGIVFTLLFVLVFAFWTVIHAALVPFVMATSWLWHKSRWWRPIAMIVGVPAAALDGAIYLGFERLWSPSRSSFVPAYRAWPDSWEWHNAQRFTKWNELDLYGGDLSGYEHRAAYIRVAPGERAASKDAGHATGMEQQPTTIPTLICVRCRQELTLRERVLGFNTHERCPSKK